ncbi:hypothetical protein GCM10009007_10810 [Formosimonas limnophila]|uniref:Dyp-type peroxidase C-terminal domain-containing protein n=1 Tax=Formosimonas limnophila TaxID=1384487 RepID=A0A8J3G0B3_9BURK|nr:Dyp-type peroxidase [Formosimonas limnophila]GHA71747.1 hypothetical protein GCM10009007_10810 [Formosimonas limnophila]
MQLIQSAILFPTAPHARYLTFDLKAGVDTATISASLKSLSTQTDGQYLLIGIGVPLVSALGCSIPDLREFPRELRMGDSQPAAALWCWLRGDERGELWQRGHELTALLQSAFILRQCVDGFTHRGGHDLTGFQDGTENPKGNAAVATAIVGKTAPDGLHGSSFVAVQQWLHQWATFNAMSKTDQDNAIGRERVSNDELEDAPESAHVKRTAQESFEPEAFVVRRSMPWTNGDEGGLMFTSFGHNLDGFEVQWRRMLGLDDGIKDALFQFSEPMTHDYFWCPPMLEGHLDLRALGL